MPRYKTDRPFTEDQLNISEIQQFLNWNETVKERGWEIFRTESFKICMCVSSYKNHFPSHLSHVFSFG